MIDRENAILMKFKELYGEAEGVGLARAPGRVNIIGEHTDYNEGFVLPIAIGRDTMVAFKPNGGREVRVHSMTKDESAAFPLDAPAADASRRWASYIVGVARALLDEKTPLVGIDMVVHSTLPLGGGLSSSAALEVSAALAFLSAAQAEMDRKAVALACRRAENDYVGMRCGVMDQYVALFGQAECAVKIDCRTLRHDVIPFRLDEARLVVCDTGVRHELASSEYNQRRAECEQGVREAAGLLPGEPIKSLRDLHPAHLPGLEPLMDATIFRRVRHVVTENARVLEAVRAMRSQNWISLGVLLDASHESLRNDYAVTCRELDLMVELAWSQQGVYGSRMTGGGFGGCTVTLVDSEHVDVFCRNVAAGYQAQTQIAPAVYVCSPEGGAEVVRAAS